MKLNTHLTDRQMEKGFITIATGDIHYYKIATNLLKSYRYFTNNPLPFAIICDQENEYTDLFDVVILLKDVTKSYMDKFLLLKLCPFTETVFLDADILAYDDLNNYWDFFKNATDFSAIGENFDLYEGGPRYNVDEIDEYGKKISYRVRTHTGVCFIRKSESLDKLYEDCIEIESNFEKLKFHITSPCADETVLDVAMPLNDMKVTHEIPESMGFLPCLTSVSAKILEGSLSYTTLWGTSVTNNGWVLHFGSIQTKQPLYRFESECLNKMVQNKQKTLLFKIRYQLGTRKISLSFSWRIASLYQRLTNHFFK